ncbi:MAG: gamma carbonic anhydrase family protein [Deltaproteobacteria bacterium]|nr:gamma carbonic anhydrase family protein [Deltaproteobacteria bacterium]
MIAPFRAAMPAIDASAYVVDSAVVIGDVIVGAESSVWFHAVVRGDVHPIRIGRRTNIQDHATLHVTTGRAATTVGDDVTIGHGAIVHGCTIGDRTLVGMGAIVLDGVEVGAECLIGAGALLTPGTRFAPGQLVVGSPARAVRSLTVAERASLLASAVNYARVAAEYRASGLR